MMSSIFPIELDSLFLSLRLAGVSVIVLLVIGIPFANWLAYTQSKAKVYLEAIVALPLVLPPTVLGFYLLLALGANGWIGMFWYSIFHHRLIFSFTSLVIGSVIYSLPFVIQPLQSAFEISASRATEVAATLGAGKLDRFVSIELPLAKRGLLTAIVLGFAHTLGEFGVVLLLGGNIPGKTKVLSIDIYEKVEQLQYTQANALSLLLLGVSFIILILLFTLNNKPIKLPL